MKTTKTSDGVWFILHYTLDLLNYLYPVKTIINHNPNYITGEIKAKRRHKHRLMRADRVGAVLAKR